LWGDLSWYVSLDILAGPAQAPVNDEERADVTTRVKSGGGAGGDRGGTCTS